MKKIDFIILIFLVLFVYADTMRVGFMWDDEYIVKKNEDIREMKISDFFNLSYWKDFRKNTSPLEIPLKPVSPLRLISLRLDYKLWGLNPTGYHITNLLMHIMVVILLYILFIKFSTRYLALFSASVFAINPIITETVIWIKNRLDIMAILFYLLSFILFIKWREVKKFIWISLSIVSYIFSLLSKEIGITLPVVLSLYLLYFDCEYNLKTKIKNIVKTTLVFWLITMFYLGFEKFVVEADKVAKLTAGYFPHLWQHIYTVFLTIAYYIFLLIYPYNQVAERYLPKPEAFYELKFLLSIAFVIAYVLFSVYIKRFDKRLSFFMLWIIITLLPVSNIIYLSTRPIAEHRLYIALCAFAYILGYIFIKLKDMVKFKHIYVFIVVAFFGSYGYSTMKRVYEWRSPVSFWKSTAEKSVPNYRTYLNLGIGYMGENNIEEALKWIKMAGEIIPEDPYVLNALGTVYITLKKYPEAINAFQRAIMRYPDFDNALTNLGYAYYLNGNIRDAIKMLEISKRLNPSYISTYIYLAEIYKSKGDFKNAEKEFLTALEKEGWPFDVHKSLIDMYEKNGMYDRAVEEYKRAININPLNIWAYNGLGICYVHKGEYDRAEESFKKAIEIDPANVIVKKNLNELEIVKSDFKRIKKKK